MLPEKLCLFLCYLTVLYFEQERKSMELQKNRCHECSTQHGTLFLCPRLACPIAPVLFIPVTTEQYLSLFENGNWNVD